MIIGIVSDTHNDKAGALEHVAEELISRGAEIIIHCGDVELKHVKTKTFNNRPVICALTDEQFALREKDKKSKFKTAPRKWQFTYPNDRIRDLGEFKAYVGHKRSFDLLIASWHKLEEDLARIRKHNDNVNYFFSGHTHHQIYAGKPNIGFINSGAIEGSIGVAGGYEFALIDTDKDEIVFSRIPAVTPIKPALTLGLVSETLDMKLMVPGLWEKIEKKFKQKKVTHVINCGNVSIDDIGHPCLADFQVYCYLRNDQHYDASIPNNWHLVNAENPVIDLLGYRFYVQHNLGLELLNQSEKQFFHTSKAIQSKFPELNFILCSSTDCPILEEAQSVMVISPGDTRHMNDFTIIELPRYEITFGRIQNDPLPPLKKG